MLCTVPGLHCERDKGDAPTIRDHRRPNLPCPPKITWDVWILTLRLNYVAGYTDPLLFLFERTYNYYVDNQGLVPWWLRRLGKSKVRSASYVRVLSHDEISEVEIQGPMS